MLVYPVTALTQLFVLQGLPAPILNAIHVNKQLHLSQGYISAVITTATRSPKSTTSFFKDPGKSVGNPFHDCGASASRQKQHPRRTPRSSPLCFNSSGGIISCFFSRPLRGARVIQKSGWRRGAVRQGPSCSARDGDTSKRREPGPKRKTETLSDGICADLRLQPAHTHTADFSMSTHMF